MKKYIFMIILLLLVLIASNVYSQNNLGLSVQGNPLLHNAVLEDNYLFYNPIDTYNTQTMNDIRSKFSWRRFFGIGLSIYPCLGGFGNLVLGQYWIAGTVLLLEVLGAFLVNATIGSFLFYGNNWIVNVLFFAGFGSATGSCIFGFFSAIIGPENNKPIKKGEAIYLNLTYGFGTGSFIQGNWFAGLIQLGAEFTSCFYIYKIFGEETHTPINYIFGPVLFILARFGVGIFAPSLFNSNNESSMDISFLPRILISPSGEINIRFGFNF